MIAYYYYYVTSVGSVTVDAYQVIEPWNEVYLTWNQFSNTPNFGLASDRLDYDVVYSGTGALEPTPGKATFDITEAFQNWVDDPDTNHGIALKYNQSSPNLSVVFHSTQSSYNYHPYFAYQYTLPSAQIVSLDLEILYDHVYRSQHTDSDGNVFAQSYLCELAAGVEEFYLREFAIQITSSTPALFTSLADSECTASSGEKCNCVDPEHCTQSSYDRDTNQITLHELHHKNLHNLLLHVPSPTDSNTARMVFFGSPTCTFDSLYSICVQDQVHGLAYRDLKIMAIANPYEDEELLTAIHEMGHIFGIEDHYKFGEGTDYRNMLENTEDYHANCIYGENKNHQTVILDRTICQGCRNKIAAYRAAHMDD